MRRNPRLFLSLDAWPPAVGQHISLSAEQQHYLVRVLRLHVGDLVDVVAELGQQAVASLLQATVGARGAWVLRVEQISQTKTEVFRPSLTLFQGLLKHDKFDWVIEKATELGVDRIVPVVCKYSIPSLDERKARERVARWREIATMASQQSLRSTVPNVMDPIAWTQLPWAPGDGSTGYVLWEKADPKQGLSLQLSQTSKTQASYAVFVGPEGGFSDEEMEHFKARGWTLCSLGPRILRAETASVAAVTLMSFWLDPAQ